MPGCLSNGCINSQFWSSALRLIMFKLEYSKVAKKKKRWLGETLGILDCRWWLQPWNFNLRRLPSGRKAMTNLDSLLKSRDITLLTKFCIVKAMVFPVVMYRCQGWTIKKAEHQRTDAFELWCRKRVLRVPWTARRPNQSILKEISPEYSLEGLMLRMKHQYFGHLMGRSNSLEKIMILGKMEGRRRSRSRWNGWISSLTQWTWIWANSGRQWRTEKPRVLQPRT